MTAHLGMNLRIPLLFDFLLGSVVFAQGALQTFTDSIRPIFSFDFPAKKWTCCWNSVAQPCQSSAVSRET